MGERRPAAVVQCVDEDTRHRQIDRQAWADRSTEATDGVEVQSDCMGRNTMGGGKMVW